MASWWSFCVIAQMQKEKLLAKWSGEVGSSVRQELNSSVKCLRNVWRVVSCKNVYIYTQFCCLCMTHPDMSFSVGIKLTLSALLDGKNINAGGHKLGLGLEFQA